MKNVVAICVYDRVENIRHWLHCWKQCNTDGIQLVIIQNYYHDKPHINEISTLCAKQGIKHIFRINVGMDLGAFQDICRNRLQGFPEWDNLLWLTDDVFPMNMNFAHYFFEQLSFINAGVVCMELSPKVRMHIRTTGFAVSHKVAERLQFPADPILTKFDCYAFEHLHKTLTFYEQVLAMRLTVMMVAPREISPLWDSGYHLREQREVEHYALFGREKNDFKVMTSSQVAKRFTDTAPQLKKVVFICPIYNKYPQIISSLICQTYKNWELHLVHDGSNILDIPNDKRIIYTKIARKTNDYGHTIRKEWLQKVTGDYVVVTNPDNFHVPGYIEIMLQPLQRKGVIASYCSQMVHSYIKWKVIECRLARGYIDSAGVMMRLDIAKQVGWNSVEHSADWFFFESVIKRYGTASFAKVEGCLITHN